MLDGELHVTLNGMKSELQPGDVALVAADSEVCVDAGPQARPPGSPPRRALRLCWPTGPESPIPGHGSDTGARRR